MRRYLVGIDDTDNAESRGTGFLSRKLAALMCENKIAEVKGITRHQLFVHPDIPYTSQNSSACLDLFTTDEHNMIIFCSDFLLSEAAEGSDAGLAVVRFENTIEELIQWGKRSKIEVLSQSRAITLAVEKGIFLEGLTGTKDGIIGALAAVGLRMYGNDGRFIWLNGKEIRDVRGAFTAVELLEDLAIDQITDKSGLKISGENRIFVGDWLRPVLIDNKTTIIAERSNSNEHEWEVAGKDYIKSITG